MKRPLFSIVFLCLLSLSLCLSGCQGPAPGGDAPSTDPDLLVKSDLKSYLVTNSWVYRGDEKEIFFLFYEDGRARETINMEVYPPHGSTYEGEYTMEGEILHIDILDPYGGMQETFQYDENKGAFMQIDVQTTRVTDQGLFRQ